MVLGHGPWKYKGRSFTETGLKRGVLSHQGFVLFSSVQFSPFTGNDLTCNLSGNIQPQSSQLAEPLWTDSGIKSGISVCKLISTSKKEGKKKAQVGNKWSNILPPILASEEKAIFIGGT